VLIELIKGHLQKIGGTSAQQVIDLVEGQASPKQTQFHLCVINLLQQVAHILQHLQLLSDEIGRERLGADRNAEQLHTLVTDPVHLSWERINTRPGGPPNLVLLHVQVETTSRTIRLQQPPTTHPSSKYHTFNSRLGNSCWIFRTSGCKTSENNKGPRGSPC